MKVEEIDSCAKVRQSPIEYSLVEYGLYSRLCAIYDAYDAGTLPLNGAKQCKEEAVREFKQWNTYREEYLSEALKRKEIGNIMAEANKYGCRYCRKVAEIYDGREKARN